MSSNFLPENCASYEIKCKVWYTQTGQSCINKIQQDATILQVFIYCKITPHVSGVYEVTSLDGHPTKTT